MDPLKARVSIDVLSESDADYVALGAAQWELIAKLEAEYAGKKVRKTNCLFEDDYWFDGDGRSDDGRVYWNNHFEENQFALKLMFKVVFFEMRQYRRMRLSTISGLISNMKHGIIDLLKSKKVLCGIPGEFMLGLGHVTNEDWSMMADKLVAEASREQGVTRDIGTTDRIFRSIVTLGAEYPMFATSSAPPWIIERKQPAEWVKQRIKDLDVFYGDRRGFESLLPESAMALVNCSMMYVESYYDQIVELHSVLMSLSCVTKKSKAPLITEARIIQQRFAQTFDSILPLNSRLQEVIGSNFTERSMISARNARTIVRWAREILYYTRAACANIVLLTTGLRNVDLRHLMVGCCKPSNRIDALYYISAYIKKTNNSIHIPVPTQTNNAINLLERIKFTGSPYLIDADFFPTFRREGKEICEKEARLSSGGALNKMLREFAKLHNIPFVNEDDDSEKTAHCYRSTVAGWLGTSSNLAVLMVRRLFGHSNDVMPTTYLRNNPLFIEMRRKQKEVTAEHTARQMAFAVSKGRVAGNKGDQLERGYAQHRSRYEESKSSSHSLTDKEIVLEFSEMIKQRIVNETMCAFLTPFGVMCGRNPTNTSQAPCARNAHRNKVKNIDKQLLDLVSDIAPQHCIGAGCSEAIIGPWSGALKESLDWYIGLVKHQHGEAFSDEDMVAFAEQFIRQYAPMVDKVFGKSIPDHE